MRFLKRNPNQLYSIIQYFKSFGLQFLEGEPLIMGKDDIYQVYQTALNWKITVIHMEAVNHWN
ncbi:hypothetical protein C0638_22045 [Paenibacillus sp. lzh-N1]|nr:hypothetical protein C0638_22045 [Paenibacillus sp. lzh-N1]